MTFSEWKKGQDEPFVRGCREVSYCREYLRTQIKHWEAMSITYGDRFFIEENTYMTKCKKYIGIYSDLMEKVV